MVVVILFATCMLPSQRIYLHQCHLDRVEVRQNLIVRRKGIAMYQRRFCAKELLQLCHTLKACP